MLTVGELRKQFLQEGKGLVGQVITISDLDFPGPWAVVRVLNRRDRYLLPYGIGTGVIAISFEHPLQNTVFADTFRVSLVDPEELGRWRKSRAWQEIAKSYPWINASAASTSTVSPVFNTMNRGS